MHSINWAKCLSLWNVFFGGDIIFTKKLKILNEREVNELFN